MRRGCDVSNIFITEQGGSLDEGAMKQTWETSQISDKALEDELNEKFKLNKFCRTAGNLDTISEEGANSENQQPKSGRTRRKGVAGKAATGRKGSMKPPKAGVLQNSKFVTPYHGSVNQASRLDTPMQTPMFDPR